MGNKNIQGGAVNNKTKTIFFELERSVWDLNGSRSWAPIIFVNKTGGVPNIEMIPAVSVYFPYTDLQGRRNYTNWTAEWSSLLNRNDFSSVLGLPETTRFSLSILQYYFFFHAI